MYMHVNSLIHTAGFVCVLVTRLKDSPPSSQHGLKHKPQDTCKQSKKEYYTLCAQGNQVTSMEGLNRRLVKEGCTCKAKTQAGFYNFWFEREI